MGVSDPPPRRKLWRPSGLLTLRRDTVLTVSLDVTGVKVGVAGFVDLLVFVVVASSFVDLVAGFSSLASRVAIMDGGEARCFGLGGDSASVAGLGGRVRGEVTSRSWAAG